MTKKIFSCRGLTLLEIIISTLIFALVMTGLVNLFITAKRYTRHTRSRIQAAELGKFFLDPLQMQVRQGESVPGANDGWDGPNNALSVGTRDCASQPGCPPAAERTLNGIQFDPQYQINAVDDPSGNPTTLRRVRVTLKWNEPPP